MNLSFHFVFDDIGKNNCNGIYNKLTGNSFSEPNTSILRKIQKKRHSETFSIPDVSFTTSNYPTLNFSCANRR